MILRIALLSAAAVFLMIIAGQAILVVTAGALLAVFLNAMTIAIMNRSGLGRGAALSVVLICLFLVLALFALQIGPEVTLQVNQLFSVTQATIQDLQTTLAQSGWGDSVEADWEGAVQRLFTEAFNIFGHITGVASTTSQVIGGMIVIGFIGLYGAAEPGTYRRGVVYLFPLERRNRIDEVMCLLGRTLGRWLFARALSMLIAGGLTWIGLILLDIPLALTLAVIATLLTFIPYLGPIIAAIPAIIVGVGESWADAAYVTLLYAVVQTVEGYIITPLLLRRTIAMPPALTLAAQIIMGVMFGFMGIALAMPLSVVGLVLVQKLYIEDVLGDEPFPETDVNGGAFGSVGVDPLGPRAPEPEAARVDPSVGEPGTMPDQAAASRMES